MDMYVNCSTCSHVQALKGERLDLNCTATAELNTRVNITWNYPRKVPEHSLKLPLTDVQQECISMLPSENKI